MATVVENKYYLRSVHEEIGLIERKLAHDSKYGGETSDDTRDAANRKLNKRHETLVATARRLAAAGIEFKPSELPRSMQEQPEVLPIVELQEQLHG
jgi:hypothetical protein